MDIKTTRDGTTLVAKVSGRIDGSNAEEFQEAFYRVLLPEDRGVVLDFEDVLYVSSAGLRALLLITKDMRATKVKYGVCSLANPVKDVFTISGFDRIINIHDDLPAALDAVGTGPG